jgi:hypothetical protein
MRTALLGVDLTTIRELATKVEPYVRVDGTKVWSLMQLEREHHLARGHHPCQPSGADHGLTLTRPS